MDNILSCLNYVVNIVIILITTVGLFLILETSSALNDKDLVQVVCLSKEIYYDDVYYGSLRDIQESIDIDKLVFEIQFTVG